MRLLIGHDQTVAKFVLDQIPWAHDFGPCVAIGVLDNKNALVGGVVFHNYMREYRSIELSAASLTPRWLTKPLIRGIMSYPFDQLKVQRVSALTPRKANSARWFLEYFGFKREGLARKGYGTDHALIYGLLDSDWRSSPWPSDRGCVNWENRRRQRQRRLIRS